MAYNPRLLPIGISSLKTMIEEDYVYIDKTKYIYDIITQGKYYFLSRPRRFGKSLLVSTLYEIFNGNKKLFDNFDISKTNYDWARYPIIKISFSSTSTNSVSDFKKSIEWKLNEIAKENALDIINAPTIETQFEQLIKELAKKNRVVILVDEYDYPLLNNINNRTLAEECRVILHNFFSVIKDLGDYIYFVFITGVTKFSKTSIFSGLNNLDDLTISDRASLLVGYTENEIRDNFKSYLEKTAKKKSISIDEVMSGMKKWYNGYRFSKTFDQVNDLVYNPFSVLLYLKEGDLLNYWFETGTPTFLMQLIKSQNYPVYEIEHSQVNIEELRTYDIDKIKLIPLLLQAGYLTIESYNEESKNFTLKYPNEETKLSLKYIMEN